MENLEIRAPKEDELNQISKIFVEESSKRPYNQDKTKEAALQQIKNSYKKGNIYVAESYGKIVGFLILALINNKDKKRAYMDELWIKAEYQGKGMGKEIVSFFEEICKKNDVDVADLITHRDANAYEFYKKQGYKESSEFVFMSKNL